MAKEELDYFISFIGKETGLMKEIRDGHIRAFNSKNQYIANVRYVGCNFEKCHVTEFLFTNCEFEACIFTNCNFTRAALALNKKYDSGKFINCSFITCNLTATSFNFPVIDGCEFRNCVLNETNFDGSRFSNTKFIGELDSCFFRGYSIFSNSGSLFSFSKFDPLKAPNKMFHVDFSLAKLTGIYFGNRIDLSKCVFPGGDDYCYISDLKKTMNRAAEVIQSEWSDGDEKETGIRLIQMVHFTKDKQEQSNDFIDAFVCKESDARLGKNVNVKFFRLIKSLQGD